MKQITINTEGIDDLDPSDPGLVKAVRIVPKRHPPSPLNAKEEILEAAMRLYSETDGPGAKFFAGCLDFKEPGSSVTFVGSPKHMTKAAGPGATVATGPSVSAGAGLLFGLSGGIFLSNTTPPIGLYGSVDAGIVTNISAGGVWQFTAFSAAPAVVFDGPPTLVIGVNISITTPGVISPQGTGYIVVQTPPSGPPRMIGAGFGFGLGAGVLPVDIYVTSAIKSGSTASPSIAPAAAAARLRPGGFSR
jgi:hypothetical protein